MVFEAFSSGFYYSIAGLLTSFSLLWVYGTTTIMYYGYYSGRVGAESNNNEKCCIVHGYVYSIHYKIQYH